MPPAKNPRDIAPAEGVPAPLEHWLRQEEDAVAGGWAGEAATSVTSDNIDAGENRLASGWWIAPVLISALPAWAALLMWIF